MLCKKVHRQYVREFWVGRKFKFRGEVYKVTRKPFIYYPKGSICVSVKYNGPGNWNWGLIVIKDSYYSFSIGERLDKDDITWLNY